MSVDFLPRQDTELLAFAQQYSAQITADPVPLGLSAQNATQLAGLVSDYQAKLAAATDGTTRGPSTVFAKDQARRSMVDYIRLTARQIQGTMTVCDQQRKDLKLPVHGESTPMPPPGQADGFKVSLNANGSLNLAWKCKNPPGSSGTIYQVWREADGGELTYLGGSGERKFTDATVPAGTSNITYHVQAVRSTAIGPWATFNVNFGAIGSTPAQVQAVKLAA